MEINQLKQSVKLVAQTIGAMVEEKLGERSQLEEQVRGIAKQVERIVSEAIWNRTMAPKVTVKFKKLEHFKGDLPKYTTAGASGLDVRACLNEPITLSPGERVLVPTGLAMEIPLGFEVQVRARSGLAIKHGLGLVNAPGTIDADYRGELKVILINWGTEAVQIQDQERIAQLVVCPVIQAEIEEAFELSDTSRGEGGFGSTGVK